MRTFLLALVCAAVGVIAGAPWCMAASDRCESLMVDATAAADRLSKYTSQPDATTSNALSLTREVRRALKQAQNACAGTDKEAGLKFSAASMEMIEAKLADSTTEKLHDLGIFMRPGEL
jgi:hypothetical protein